jgi:hypothetical protein
VPGKPARIVGRGRRRGSVCSWCRAGSTGGARPRGHACPPGWRAAVTGCPRRAAADRAPSPACGRASGGPHLLHRRLAPLPMPRTGQNAVAG